MYICFFLTKNSIKEIHENKLVTKKIKLINELGLLSFVFGIFGQLISLIEGWHTIQATTSFAQSHPDIDLNMMSVHYMSFVPDRLFYTLIYPIMGLVIFIITRLITRHLSSLHIEQKQNKQPI